MQSSALMNPAAAEELKIRRMRELARVLQERAMEEAPTQVVGGYAVPQSGWQALAKGIQGLTGSVTDAFATSRESDLAKSLKASRDAALQSGDPAQMLATGDPLLTAYATRKMELAQKAADDNKPTSAMQNAEYAAGGDKEKARILVEQSMQDPFKALGLQLQTMNMQNTEAGRQRDDARADKELALREAQARQDAAYREFQRQESTREKPPSGYRPTPDGALEPIPGGPADPANRLDAKPLPLPPANIVNAYRENNLALEQLDKAEKALDAHQNAVGMRRVVPDFINQRLDPEGVDARAAIADIGSLKIHDRSGAAVSAAEAPRLKPFIPAVTDDPATVRKKLKNFREQYQQIQNDLQTLYSPENGYNLPTLGAKPDAAPTVDLSPETIEQVKAMPDSPEKREIMQAIEAQKPKGGIKFLGFE